MLRLRFRTLVLLAFGTASVLRAQDVKIDADTFGGLEARSIGPAAMSGRITAIDALEGDRLTIYAGSASGGLWKSVDGGLAFKPIFDKHSQSIGAVTIDRKNPKTVWVGTGETCTRNSVSVGDGLYKTTDGGESWQKLGLADSERIAKIVIDPQDSNTRARLRHRAPVRLAPGARRLPHHGRRQDLGEDAVRQRRHRLLRPRDRPPGRQHRLRRDVAVPPQALLLHLRRPGQRPLQVDRRRQDLAQGRRKGLAEGELGRIALAVAPTRPSVVYATVEAKQTALYRSDDLGESWTSMNTSSAITGRPFYFSHLSADPRDWKRIYRPGFSLSVSDDGGKTFSGVGGGG